MAVLAVTALACAATACGGAQAREVAKPAAEPAALASTPPARTASPAASVVAVSDRALVCMVNDRDMGVAQIPVQVEGKTYYGCCEMCKGRLAEDRAVRKARDPLTGKSVDKATATIGRAPDGRVLYFENAGNLARYAEKGVPKVEGAQ